MMLRLPANSIALSKLNDLVASAMPAIATNVTVVWSVRLSHSCTLLKPLDGMRCCLVG